MYCVAGCVYKRTAYFCGSILLVLLDQIMDHTLISYGNGFTSGANQKMAPLCRVPISAQARMELSVIAAQS